MEVARYWVFICVVQLLVFEPNKVLAIEKHYLDSVEQVYKTTTNKKDKLYCLYVLSFENGLFNPRKGIAIGQQLLQQARLEKDSTYILNAYNGMANCYETMMMFDSALYLNEIGYKLIEKSTQTRLQYATLSNIATCHKKLGHYNLAIQYYDKVMELAKNMPEHNPRVYYYLCELYLRVGNTQKAKEIVLNGLSSCENRTAQKNYFQNILHGYLGLCYAKLSISDSATYFLNKSVKGLEKETDVLARAHALAMMADVQLQFEAHESALVYYNQALQLYHQLGNKPLEVYTAIKIVHTKVHLNKYPQVELARELVTATNYLGHFNTNYDLLLDTYKHLSLTYEKLNNHKMALFYFKKTDSLYQNILNNEARLMFRAFEQSYETLKREKKITELKATAQIYEVELDTKATKLRLYGVIITLIAVIFIILVTLLNLFYKKRRALMHVQHELGLQESKQTERLRISKDLHDDIGSGLNKLLFLSERITKDNKQQPELLKLAEKMEVISKKLISNMRDMIWVLNEDNQQVDTLIARIREYSYDYLEEKNITFQFNSNIDSNAVINSPEIVRTIISIVKELLSNVLKHSQATKVYMEFNKTGKKLTIVVTDDGVGFDETIKYGNGIKNMHTRAKDIGADFNLETKKHLGTRTTLVVTLK